MTVLKDIIRQEMEADAPMNMSGHPARDSGDWCKWRG
ncbi:hypothetical protein EVA_17524, partial [gut metagenome]